ncbi:hypothetical protein [Streptomyces griseorubiginosus]|uniref:hypothetical protein n=1 Tax=Streptomyces griseorubiginosus TaxID=67304 RepID=UPI0033D29EB3
MNKANFGGAVVLASGVALSTAGVGVQLGEHQMPTELSAVGCQLLDHGGVFDVEGLVVQPRTAAIVLYVDRLVTAPPMPWHKQSSRQRGA